MPKLEKCENPLFLQNHFAFTLTNLSNMLRFYENDSILNATFSAFTKTTNTSNKNNRCPWWLSSVCTKLKPATTKNNEILEINVLQKFTPHALSGSFRYRSDYRSLHIRLITFTIVVYNYFIIPRRGSSTQLTEHRTTLDLSFLVSPDVTTNSIVIAVWPLTLFSKKCVDEKTNVERSCQELETALYAEFYKSCNCRPSAVLLLYFQSYSHTKPKR